MRTCDIIIPNYNSGTVLAHAITALSAQDIPSSWSPRLLVVDDGSTDGSTTFLQTHTWPSAWRPHELLLEEHKGVAAARMRGLKTSQADVVLFLGADILLRPGALGEHLTFHNVHPEASAAALGMIVWDPRVRPSPLMDWMMHGGQQNDYDALLGVHEADPAHFFYGAHVSCKRAMFTGLEYPTGHSGYGWEDLDMGAVLQPRGMTLTILHRAIGLHAHRYSPGDIIRRQRAVGRHIHVSARAGSLAKIGLGQHARLLKIFLYRWSGIGLLGRALVYVLGEWWTCPRLFLLVTSGEFWIGWKQGLRARYAEK